MKTGARRVTFPTRSVNPFRAMLYGSPNRSRTCGGRKVSGPPSPAVTGVSGRTSPLAETSASFALSDTGSEGSS